MANNPFQGKALGANLLSEIDARKKTTALDQWFASRTLWLSVKSMCTDCQTGPYAKYSTLNTTYDFQNTHPGYLDGTARPSPVVTGVKVTATGNLGATRQCTISMIAFTEDQLEGIEACYLISNMSVRVEFGWNVGANSLFRAPAPVSTPRKYPDGADPKAICAINNQRDKYPIYDGLQGKVGKWRISYNKDGQYWDITVDIVAASSPVLMMPLEDYSTTCNCQEVQQNPNSGDEEDVKVTRSAFRSFILRLIRLGQKGNRDGLNEYLTANEMPNAAILVHLNGAQRNEDGSDSSSLLAMASKFLSIFGNTPESDEVYITLEGLMKAVEKFSFTTASDKSPSVCKFDLNSMSVGVKKGYTAHSSDPHICLLPGVGYDRPDEDEGYKGLNAADETISYNGIYIGRVLVNTIFINKVLNDLGKNIILQDFLDRVLTGINEALANLWDLAIIDTGNCSNAVPTLAVIDLNSVKQPAPTELTLKANPAGRPALVRDIKLELQLTAAMQSQALYAESGTQTQEDACQKVRYGNELGKNLAAPPVKEPDTSLKKKVCSGDCEPGEPDKDKTIEQIRADVFRAFLKLRNEITQEHKQELYTNLISYYNKAETEGDVVEQCKKIVVPYELSFTLDGIGGFQFGQFITTDVLPKKQQDTYVYQVTAVEQDISYNDWTTTVKAVARYK